MQNKKDVFYELFASQKYLLGYLYLQKYRVFKNTCIKIYKDMHYFVVVLLYSDLI